MVRTLSKVALVIAGLYMVLHLILGSSPVQRRVLGEVQKALVAYGMDLQIESIEFSPFSPKIYLNRVTLKSKPDSEFGLPPVMPIDKIKIEFRPLALISRQIVINEAVIFHPRLNLPAVDKTYLKVTTMLNQRLKFQPPQGGFSVSFNRFGVVDAMFDVASSRWDLAARSRSLSFMIETSAGSQHTLTVDSTNLYFRKERLKLDLTRVDAELDISPRSLRVNRALLEGENLSINVRGTTSLPLGKELRPQLLQTFYEIKIPLSFLNMVLGPKFPPCTGQVASSGTLNLSPTGYAAKGTASFEKIVIDDIGAGSGQFSFQTANEKLKITNLIGKYSQGDVRSDSVEIDLKDRFAVAGDFDVKGMALESLLENLDSPFKPTRSQMWGQAKLQGNLKSPLQLKLGLRANFDNFHIVKNEEKPSERENTILTVPSGSAQGMLVFFEDRMDFDGKFAVLEGEARTQGYIGYDNTAKVRVEGENISVTKLGRIGDLEMGGTGKLTADVEVKSRDVKVSGSFDTDQAEIAGLVIGKVKGEAFYRSDLLTFENLQIPALEPVTGNGFIDFRPKDLHYKFNIDVKRAFTDQVFAIFRKKPQKHIFPSLGEVSTRILVEGGGDRGNFEVISTGQARDFKIGPESWRSGLFSITYRPDALELNRVLLLKKLGSLEVRGIIAQEKSRVSLQTGGFRIEELNSFGRSPLGGELIGEVLLEGDLEKVPERGSGELRLVKTNFRGVPLPDSYLRASTKSGLMEVEAQLFGEKLQATLVRENEDPAGRILRLSMREFDFMPVLTAAMGKDLSTINEVLVSGDIRLRGDFSRWDSVNGTGAIPQVVVGLKGTPMRNSAPLAFTVEAGAYKINRFQLTGAESQLYLDLTYSPGTRLEASIDGKMDLQFLQPFVPGMDYGTGKVTAGIRFFGKPTRFDMVGNISLEDGVMRIAGLRDEVRSFRAKLSLSQDRINIDKAEGVLNGGRIEATGAVVIDRFGVFQPNLRLAATRVLINPRDYLSLMFSGAVTLSGAELPYNLSGRCQLLETKLTQLNQGAESFKEPKDPVFKFDVSCEAKDKLFVQTDILNAEFKGNLHLLGNDQKIGLTGNVDAIGGELVFRDTKFALTNGTVRFESPEKILPRFNISGHAIVKANEPYQGDRFSLEQDYDVALQALGTPDDYKIRLNSTPTLSEAEIVSLLVIGVPRLQRDQMTQSDTSIVLGTALANELKLQSKIQSALGVDIRLNAQSTGATAQVSGPNLVPSVQLQYGITKTTKLYYSNSINALASQDDTRGPLREFKIEQLLDDNLTVNGTAVNRSRGSTNQATPSYGIDLRYRFSFE